jgi:hypothetical protein
MVGELNKYYPKIQAGISMCFEIARDWRGPTWRPSWSRASQIQLKRAVFAADIY